ncbi:cytochrome P450 [Ponticaulis sp.]|uniref:cytochrome P450 n=1 Tax=Ponticaulis sp. TaxID=2020902 RepID=UPI002632F96B|nr:cytochrome P450 [Ponticaulis sp.]MDF1679568.1 cytochrome P450 [Ponticaulis sp.]
MADTASEVADTQEERDWRLDRKYVIPGGPVRPASSLDLSDLDISDPELWRRESYWDRFARLRDEEPVHYCSESAVGPYWSVTRYEDIMAVDTDHKRFSSAGGITLVDLDEDFSLPMFIAMDQPKHDVQRKTVQPIVAPDNLRNFESLIRERTAKVLDSLPVGEPFDWVDTVSIELTTMMLATLFNFPFEDRRKLTRWSDVATGRENPEICPGGEEQWRAELMECLGYFTELWNQRVNANEPGNDLISMLATGEHTKNMEPMEYLGNVILLIVGGNDTTRNSMTASVLGMNLFPKEFDKLKANHDLIPSMVSEIIRWQTPLAHMRRTALEDVELGGKTIKAGEKVLMWYVSGNRDERHFERPNDIWIDRPKVRSHLSFGFGIHRCVGNRLGEMQLKILWEEFFKRFEDIIVVKDAVRTPSCFVKGYTEMMVELVPKK